MAKNRGVDWQVVTDTTNLPREVKKLYEEYRSLYEEVQIKGTNLRKAANREWEATYPEGFRGKYFAFLVVNGQLMCGEVTPILTLRKGIDPFDL